MRRLWAFTLFLMFLTTAPRTGQAEGESPPASERLQAMIAAGEIGTDETFQRLKKERGFLPDTVAPKGFRSLVGRREFPFRKLRGGFRQEKTSVAILWRTETEIDKEVAEVTQLVREHLEADGYVGTDRYLQERTPIEAFLRQQYSGLERRCKALLVFRKESSACREVVLIAVKDRDALPGSKVTVAAQWALLDPAPQGPLTYKDVTATFPMLKGAEVDSRIADALASTPVCELETSLQEAAADRTQSFRALSLLGGWNFETDVDLRPLLKEALTAAQYAPVDQPGLPEGSVWKRAAGENAMVYYDFSEFLQRTRTRLVIRRYVDSTPAATAEIPRGAPAGVPPARPRTLRPGREPSTDPSAKPLSVAAALSSLAEEAGIGTDEAFDSYKESAGLFPEAVAPKGMRQLLLRPDLGLGRLQVRLVRDEAGLTVTWGAETQIDTELATLGDQIQEQMTKLGFRKQPTPASRESLPLELALLAGRSKVVQIYERKTGATTEFVFAALSDRAVGATGTGVGILWSAESSAALAPPPTLSAAFEALPALRPAEFDAAILDALSAAPLQEWHRSFESSPGRRPSSLGFTWSAGSWRCQIREDLRTGVGDGLLSVGFVAAEPGIPEGAAGRGGALLQTWTREGERVTVQFHPVRPGSPGVLPTLIVTGSPTPGFRPPGRPR